MYIVCVHMHITLDMQTAYNTAGSNYECLIEFKNVQCKLIHTIEPVRSYGN